MQQINQRQESQTREILEALNRIIVDVTQLRNQVVLMQAENRQNSDPDWYRPIEEEEFFGMWADREDMKGKTSREWLEEQRREQWNRHERT